MSGYYFLTANSIIGPNTEAEAWEMYHEFIDARGESVTADATVVFGSSREHAAKKAKFFFGK